jgi:hypothetical protein
MRAARQVLLDVASIAPDRILLLDSYFYVVVFHGTSIAQWRKEGYHLQPEHAGFKQLLEVGVPLRCTLLAGQESACSTSPALIGQKCCLQHLACLGWSELMLAAPGLPLLKCMASRHAATRMLMSWTSSSPWMCALLQCKGFPCRPAQQWLDSEMPFKC